MAKTNKDRTSIVLGVLTLVGVLGGALFANWDKVVHPLFSSLSGVTTPGRDSTLDKENPVELPAQSQTGGVNNTQIQKVEGNVTINAAPAGAAEIARDPADRARAELQTLGVQWDSKSFVGAIVDGDVRTVGRFLDGGMRLDVNYSGATVVVYALQPGSSNRKAVVEAFLASGFKPDTMLIDARFLSGYGSSLPPHFEHAALPREYAPWQDVFAGPADLWLTIRGAYAGANSDDFVILQLLAKHGASFELSMAFLEAYAPYWGDTPAYAEVRREIERLLSDSHSKNLR